MELPGKTEKARAALQSRSPALNAMDRRLLILSDGKRSREALLALFGVDAAANLDRLLQEGYLEARAAPGLLAHAADGLATMLRPRGPAQASPPPVPPAALPRTPAASRRSLAAAKMYVVDMLQLQRSEACASLRAAIHTAPSEEELVFQLCKAVRHLRATTAATYGERIATRLGEILPEPWLPRLHAALAADGAASSAAQGQAVAPPNCLRSPAQHAW